jgi:hypothetical protein
MLEQYSLPEFTSAIACRCWRSRSDGAAGVAVRFLVIHWVRSARDETVIEFVIRPTDQGWEICRDGINIGRFVTLRQALKTLAAMRAELRGSGQRSLVKLESRSRHHAANRRPR